MPDPVCRLSIRHGPDTVDLALPRDTPVGVLLPSIVDLVHRGTVTADEGRQWYLSRVGQERLDEATSLYDNAIRDGELLLLTTAAAPAPQWSQSDAWHTLIETADTCRAPARFTAMAACLCTTVLGAAALLWSGVVTQGAADVITGGVIAGAAAAGAVVMRRAHPDPILCVPLCVVAVVFAAVAGFLAVPDGPSTANALLSAAAACSTSILLFRITGCGAICLIALATFAALTSAASACGVAWTLPVSTTGAALSVLALGALGAAARLSIAVAGLARAIPGSGPRAEDDPTVETRRAVIAHNSLTGLVIGAASAAALGALLVVSSRVHEGLHWLTCAFFAGVVGQVLLLRTRTYIDMRRRVALVIGGTVAIAAGSGLVVISAPEHANWVCLLAIAVGLSTPGTAFGATVGPLACRAVEVLEYLALAAVAPLACWVSGLYGLVRGLSLP
jgi:type VII secretion integral membrane protein EccD